jgi:hypothetical protein
MNNNKNVKAFFGPPIAGSGIIESITFESDHGVLHSDNGTFADVGPLYTEPEWTSDCDNFPITHTKNTTITATVKLSLQQPGRPFRLTGNGLAGYLNFTRGAEALRAPGRRAMTSR